MEKRRALSIAASAAVVVAGAVLLGAWPLPAESVGGGGPSAVPPRRLTARPLPPRLTAAIQAEPEIDPDRQGNRAVAGQAGVLEAPIDSDRCSWPAPPRSRDRSRRSCWSSGRGARGWRR